MNKKQKEAAFILNSELSDIYYSLEAARQVMANLLQFFQWSDPKEAAKNIQCSYLDISLMPSIAADYIISALRKAEKLVDESQAPAQ